MSSGERQTTYAGVVSDRALNTVNDALQKTNSMDGSSRENARKVNSVNRYTNVADHITINLPVTENDIYRDNRGRNDLMSSKNSANNKRTQS